MFYTGFNAKQDKKQSNAVMLNVHLFDANEGEKTHTACHFFFVSREVEKRQREREVESSSGGTECGAAYAVITKRES